MKPTRIASVAVHKQILESLIHNHRDAFLCQDTLIITSLLVLAALKAVLNVLTSLIAIVASFNSTSEQIIYATPVVCLASMLMQFLGHA